VPFDKTQQVIKQGQQKHQRIKFPLVFINLVSDLAQVPHQDYDQKYQETEDKAGN
jgi:hypothetical protein